MTLSSKQKKILAVAIVVIFGSIEALFLFGLVFILFDQDTGRAETAISFIFTMGIFGFPLWWGVNFWRASHRATSPNLSNQEMDLPATGLSVITIQTKVGLRDYRGLIYRISYTSPAYIFLNLLGLSLVSYYLVSGRWDWYILFSVLFILYLPIAVYRNATSNYQATKALREVVTYEFTSENITATGETFKTTVQWRTLFKVRRIGTWILLYSNKQVAMLIPENAFASTAEFDAFKRMWPRG